ncbi:MAG: hypothetical protein AMXMBFR7_33110 [Planctomycetota bacterium]
MPETPNPELEAIAEHLAKLVQINQRQETESIKRHLDEKLAVTEDRIERRIDSLRSEMRGELRELKQGQESHAKELSKHSTSIARIETRLTEGERRFEALETRQASAEGKGEKVTEKVNEHSVDIKALAMKAGGLTAAGGAGGAIAAVVSKLLGG